MAQDLLRSKKRLERPLGLVLEVEHLRQHLRSAAAAPERHDADPGPFLK